MRYLKITDKLFLVEQDIKKQDTKEVKVDKKLNHIFIYDRSGSMCGALPTLAKDLKTRLRTVPVGDTVTIGWFSSPGEFRFPLKGLKITGKADYEALDKVIDKNSTTLGSTCFSEILDDTQEVVKDLSALGNTFSLVFLTDGYPTVYPYEKEVQAINKAIKAVSGSITTSLLVGYGDYYNKELLSDMASKFGGSLIHSGDLADFPPALARYMDNARQSEGKIEVELFARPHKDGAVFSLGDGQVNVFEVENGTVLYSPTKGAVDRLYVLTDKAPKGDSTSWGNADEQFTKALYAAAYILTQRTKTDLALDTLGFLGDKALIDRVNNAFTNAEYGAAEQGLLNAVGRPQARFVGGRDVKYLPKPDAFCLLDALDLLMNDPEAEFYPYHDDFEYKKIGVGSKPKEGYPKFEAKKDARVPLVDLKWNDTKLNLSVLAKIEGTIELNTGYKKVGLEKTFKTFVWRSYALVKDGFLNVQKLPVTLSKESYDRFLAEGVIDKEHSRHYKGRAYTLHLNRIPVINRKIAEGKTSAKQLAANAIVEAKHEANLKALNFVRNEIEPKEVRGLGLDLSAAQEEFLKENGVTKNGFAPPTEKLEATDFYMAKEFVIAIKGLSSLPKVEDVRKKIAEKKTLTVSQQLVADGLALVKRMPAVETNVKLDYLDGLIAREKTSLNMIRSDIQRTKFAVILAKKWFEEFTSREDNTLTVAGNEVTISVKETKVNI
jgi:hypothetical protein